MAEERDPIKAAEGQLELARRESRDKGPHYLGAFEDASKIRDSGEAGRVRRNIMASIERDFDVVFTGGFVDFGRAAQRPPTEIEKCEMSLKLLDMYGKELLRHAGSVAENSQVCTQVGSYYEKKGELLEIMAGLRDEEGRKKMAQNIYADAAEAYSKAAEKWGGSYEAGMARKQHCEKKAEQLIAQHVPPETAGKIRGKG